jgi:hypothetical protein
MALGRSTCGFATFAGHAACANGVSVLPFRQRHHHQQIDRRRRVLAVSRLWTDLEPVTSRQGVALTARSVASALAFSVGGVMQLVAAHAADPDAVTAMQRFIATANQPHAYRATRRLEASGSGQRGWLDAHTEFTPELGLHYEVTAEGGSGYIRSRVLRSLLEQERRLIARGDSAAVALSAANYTFQPDGFTADGLARVTLKPRRKERALIAGHALVRPEDGELVRVEGRLAKNPSFWVTRVEMVRTYRRIHGALVPVLLESTAQLRLLGRSTLRMSYRYSEIDATAVVDSEP